MSQIPSIRDERLAVSPFNTMGLDGSPAFKTPPKIADCTLRDGEQQPGVVFSRQDKVALAVMLDAAGIADLEAGTPATSDEDRLALEEIASLNLRAEVSALARATNADVDLVAACGADSVRISLPISSWQRDAKLKLNDEEYLTRALSICSHAKSHGLRVVFSPYDTTRADVRFLDRVLRALATEGLADRVRLVDTVGAATPQSVAYLVGVMLEATGGLPIEVHCHDDLGLATANTVAGALAGASYLSVTVNGIGERSGNAPLEEVVVALGIGYGIDMGIRLDHLSALSAEVVSRSGVALQAHKAVVGSNCFTHETGTVVAGLLSNPFSAEAYRPEAVGQKRRIVLGKKSGAASIEHVARDLGLEIEPERLPLVLRAVKSRSIQQKGSVEADAFREIVREVAAQARNKA